MPRALVMNDYDDTEYELTPEVESLGYTVTQHGGIDGALFFMESAIPEDGDIVVLSPSTIAWQDFRGFDQHRFDASRTRVKVFHYRPLDYEPDWDSNYDPLDPTYANYGVTVFHHLEDLHRALRPITEDDVQAAIDSIRGAIK